MDTPALAPPLPLTLATPALPAEAPRILLVSGVHWATTTRLGMALIRGGFAVAAAAPATHALRQVHGLAGFHAIDPYDRMGAQAARIVRRWSPDLVIPADDMAIACLHRLHRAGGALADLIRRSLGEPSSFPAARRKSELVALAAREGLPVPPTMAVASLDALRQALAHDRYPLVLKIDASSGGLGVRIVASAAEAESAFRDLSALAGWKAAAKHSLKRLTVDPLGRQWRDGRPAITVQTHIDGLPANRAVACWEGEVLAGHSVEAVRTMDATGPASVVRLIEHPEMERIARHLVGKLGLSGFVGFDFVIERDTGRPFLLEMNARPTQICHFPQETGADLCAALFARITGGPPPMALPVPTAPIALYPQERWRDPDSEYLAAGYEGGNADMPDQPEIMLAYARPVAPEPPSWVDHLRRLRRRSPHIALPDPKPLDTQEISWP